jgi:hypothetical protein
MVSGATAVQIVYCSHGGSRKIEHIGSAHDDAELELLKADWSIRRFAKARRYRTITAAEPLSPTT